jgi:hypothetical protein
MLDSITRVVDRLIQLVERKEQRDRRLFVELAAPLFRDLESTHRDYLDLLRETRRRLEKSGPVCAATYIKERRIDFEPTRAKLWAAEGAVWSEFGGRTDPWGQFGKAVRLYLNAPIGAEGYDSWDSQMSYYVLNTLKAYIDRPGESNESPGVSEHLTEMIDSLIEHIRKQWAVAAEKFEALKVAVMS